MTQEAQRNLLIAKVEAAKNDVLQAENDLERLMADLRSQSRAEKMTISKTLEAAFDKLRRARIALGEVEQLLAADLRSLPP